MKHYIIHYSLFLLAVLATILTATSSGDQVIAETPSTPPGFSSLSQEELAQLGNGNGEKFVFETEVNRMMKIIINSLYKSKGKLSFDYSHIRY